MTTQEPRFQAFMEAVRRSRWFILATVILSSLMLCHVYLERFSLQSAALQGVLSHRIQRGTSEQLAQMEKQVTEEAAKYKNSTIPDDVVTRIDEFARRKYLYTVTQNELASSKLGDRSLPFLGMPIPADDYIPVMSVMLAIFTLGVWLNTRSIWACLPAPGDRNKKEFVRLARLFFTFTGVIDGKLQSQIASVIQYFALWMPFIACTIAMGVDVYPVIRHDPKVYIGPQNIILVRVLLMLVVWLVVALSALGSTLLVRHIDGQMTDMGEKD